MWYLSHADGGYPWWRRVGRLRLVVRELARVASAAAPVLSGLARMLSICDAHLEGP